MTRARHITLLIGIILALFTSTVWAGSAGWQDYKNRFLLPEGRIIDSGNHNVSHTEGQGFGMLLAVYNNDRPTFDLLLKWTNSHLYRADIGLYSWRYDPSATPPVADKNNASDGDTLIAWALLLAGQKWQQPTYRDASDKLQAAILKNNVIDFAGYKVMLPGAAGFNQTSSVTLNPSYFVFPAWQAFYQSSHLKVWSDLSSDGIKLLSKMRFGEPKLATDWVTLQADGTLMPADRWPPRFSFDAVRIPLYLNWAQPNSLALGPYVAYWRQYDRLSTPAWVDVLSAEKAPFMLPPGMQAIRDAIMGDGSQVSDQLQTNEDYYSASLHLMTWWSVHH